MLTKKTGPKTRSRKLKLKWSVEDILLLIESVKGARILWASHKHQHITKRHQWQLISQNAFERRISPNELKQKWQNLRCQFYDYVTKVKNTPIHEVRWQYYAKLSFLLTQSRARASAVKGIEIFHNKNDSETSLSNFSVENQFDDRIITNAHSDLRISNVTTIEPNTSNISVQTDDQPHLFSCDEQVLREMVKHISSRPCDDSQIFCDYLAVQMRRLSVNKRMALEVKIQNFMMETIDDQQENQLENA